MVKKTEKEQLKDYLLEQIETVTNEDLQGKDLEQARKRADSVCKIVKQIVDVDRTELEEKRVLLDAAKLYTEHRTALKNSTFTDVLGIENHD